MSNTVNTIGVLTGGGDCPGLNAVIRAVTKTAINHYGLRVIGIHDAFLGLIQNRTTTLSNDSVSGILTTGGTILGTTNKVNPYKFPVTTNGQTSFQDVRDKCVKTARLLQIDVLVVIGGDGSMSVALGLAQKGIPCIGVPKTIDNDLVGTEITFGFNTAVTTATDALDKVHSTASSHHRVMIVEVMGRYAGWIALHAGVASGADVILIPEIPYHLDAVCDFVEYRSQHGRSFSIICVAEGAHPAGGQQVVARTVADSPEPIRLGGIGQKLADDIENQTGIESRAVILGHVQRGGAPTPFDRTLATSFGHFAVQRLMAGETNCVVARQKFGLTTVPLAEVANKTRTVPLDHPLIQAARALNTSFGTK